MFSVIVFSSDVNGKTRFAVITADMSQKNSDYRSSFEGFCAVRQINTLRNKLIQKHGSIREYLDGLKAGSITDHFIDHTFYRELVLFNDEDNSEEWKVCHRQNGFETREAAGEYRNNYAKQRIASGDIFLGNENYSYGTNKDANSKSRPTNFGKGLLIDIADWPQERFFKEFEKLFSHTKYNEADLLTPLNQLRNKEYLAAMRRKTYTRADMIEAIMANVGEINVNADAA